MSQIDRTGKPLMGEIFMVDPNQISPEMLDAQGELDKLWKRLKDLNEIPATNIIEIPSQYLALREQSNLREPVPGLESGKLIAVKRKSTQNTHFNLMHLKHDAWFESKYPLKPVTVMHDTESENLPFPVAVDKWSFGIKIGKGVGETSWFYHQGEAEYFDLPEDTAKEALKLYSKLRGEKQSWLR